MDMPYRPLNVEDDEIRLISLLRGDGVDISATLEHFSIINPPSYTALSYCWGDPSVTRIISINNHNFQVTSNLEAALRQLRADGCVKLWVDAICINQQDDEERSKQVLRMSYIYRRATKVVSWSGIAVPGSERAMVLIENLACFYDILHTGASTKHLLSRQSVRASREKAGADVSELVKKSFSEDTDSWVAFSQFLERPYWRRAWVIQEITVAADIVVQCGQQTTSWINLTKAVQLWNLAIKTDRSNDARNASFNTLRVFHENAHANNSLSLLNALHQSWASLATDPRDKIFALLGLAYDSANFVPSPSYKRSLTEIFIAMTISAVSSFRSLDVMSLLGHGYSGKSSVPSWAPIWTDISGPRSKYQIQYLYGNAKVPVRDLDSALKPQSGLNPGVTNCPRFDATAGSQPVVKFHGPVATVRGLVIDSVHTLSSGHATTAEMTIADRSVSDESTCPTNPYGTKSEIFHALWKALTICGNWSLIRNDEDYLTNLWSPRVRQVMQRIAPIAFSWLNHNQNFLIHGHTLRQWIEDFKWSYKPFGKILEAKLEHNFFLQVAFGSPMYIIQCADQWTIIRDIEAALAMNYQLLTTVGGYIGWTSTKSQEGDLICLILGCSTPVVLRKTSDHEYHLIGVSYIPGLMDGEGMKDLNDDAWVSLSIC